MRHEQNCQKIFKQACQVLGISGFKLQTIGEFGSLQKSKNRYVLGSINLRSKIVKVKIYTPKLSKPKSYASILRVIAHALAHWQKPPFKQLFKGRWINRMHFPEFYEQVNENIEKFRKDKFLKQCF